MDAPGHFTAGGRLTPELKASELILPIVVIDIAKRAESDPDTVVNAHDLRRYERRHGRIPNGALVAMDSGLGQEGRRRGGLQGRPGRRLPLPRLRRRGDRVPARAAQGGGDRRRHAEPRQRSVDHVLGPRRVARSRQLRAREPEQPRQAARPRRDRHRRRDPVAGRLGRPGAGARHLLVDELADGLWRWTARHGEWHPGEWGAQVASFALDAGDVTAAVDPLVPDEDFLDRAGQRAGGDPHHDPVPHAQRRAAERALRRDDLRPPGRGQAAAERRRVEPIDGELPGGARAFPIGKPRRHETPIHLPSHQRARVRRCASSRRRRASCGCGTSTRSTTRGRAGTASASCRRSQPLRELSLQRILVTHGEPVLSDGSAALEAALEAPPWNRHG